jgi:formiminotetrahydrofolate cyclodeaminase
MPVDRTGVATAAMAASAALDLLSNVIEISKPAEQADWANAARSEADTLRRTAAEDVAAYNRYLQRSRSSATAEDMQSALRETIEVPMRAARAAAKGLELCASMAGRAKASVAADLGVAAALLVGAVRGILLCVDANLPAHTQSDAHLEAVRIERRGLEDRARRDARAIWND